MLALMMKSSSEVAAQNTCFYDCVGPIGNDYGNNTQMCIDLHAKGESKCANTRFRGAIAYGAKDRVWAGRAASPTWIRPRKWRWITG
jgi:hypothetical protein